MKSDEKSIQRLIFIDVSKALGIILVVLEHNLGNGKVYDYIYSFHMPLFLSYVVFPENGLSLVSKNLVEKCLNA